jgi:hypothetical protein
LQFLQTRGKDLTPLVSNYSLLLATHFSHAR